MNVLYIIDPVTQGGASESFLEVIAQMSKHGVYCYVCTSKSSPFDARIQKAGGTPIPVGHMTVLEPISPYKWKRPIKYPVQWLRFRIARFRALRKIKKKVELSNIDLIHTNSARNDIGCYLNKKYGIPHVMHIREFADKDFQCISLDKNYIATFNKYTSSFIAVSDAVKKHWIENGIDASKITVIYNGIQDDIKASSDICKKDEKLKCVMTSGICEAKGQMQLLQALALMKEEQRRKYHVDFIGWSDPRYLSKLEVFVHDNNLANSVSFLGKSSCIHDILQNYQIGFTCSKSEGFGRVTAEYMLAKLGVIASDTGANPELIKDGFTGLLYREGDVKNLLQKMLYWINNRENLIECSKKAYLFAKDNFTSVVNADNIYKHYLYLLE